MSTISKRVQAIQVSGIRRVFDLAAKLKNPIDLSIGQPDFETPLEIKAAAILAIKQGFNKYGQTQGILPLRQKLAKKLKSKNQIEARPEEILVTSGVSGGLFLTFSALFNPGEEIIVIDPYFVGYRQTAVFLGIRPRFVNTYPDFKLPLEKIEEAVSRKTKAILLNSPANPNGKVLNQKEVEAVVKIAKKHDLFIISDEIYEDFIYDGLKNFSPASIYKKTITLSGFSKSYAIPGWRLGYLHGPKEMVQEMAKLQQYVFVCLPVFIQKAGIRALELDIAQRIRKNYQQKRDLVYNGLKDCFPVIKPEGAFYLFPEAPQKKGMEFVKRAIGNNVLIAPGSAFSQRDSHFRISFAASKETLLRGIKALRRLAKNCLGLRYI